MIETRVIKLNLHDMSEKYESCLLLINASGEVLQSEYIVML